MSQTSMIFGLGLVIASATALAQPRFDLRATPTAYGLYPVTGTEMDRVYARTDAGLAFYRSVYVAPVSVSFRGTRDESGQPVAVAINPEKVDEMREYFATTLREKLTETDYEVVDQPVLGTLRVRAAIVDLTIGPGAAAEGDAASVTYFDSIAEMKLIIELSNPTTGELLVQVVDKGAAVRSPDDGDAKVTNRDAVVSLLDGWASLAATRLQQIKALGGALPGY